MRLTFVLLVAALHLLAATARAEGDPDGARASVAAQETPKNGKTPYERHMDNGWKLYHEQNYPAAAAEFRAAYQAEPKASPLINLALTHKKLFEYPKAIEVLELALAKHADSMKPEHRQAAEREIQELSELLAWVVVNVDPAEAKLTIDGDVQDAKPGEPIPLSPGTHRFRAEAEGYKPLEVRKTLTSGRSNEPIALALSLVTGKLTVAAHYPDALIEVDGKQRDSGRWTGLLPPGVHAVRIVRGSESEQTQVFVREGGNHHVTQDEDGELTTDSPAPLDDDDDKDVEEVRRGLYGTGAGSLLTAFANADGFTPDGQGRDRWGAAGALHLGFRVADWAGFEVMGQFSDIRVLGKIDSGDPATPIESKMVLQTWRVGGLVRVMYPTRTMFRFVATVGAGVLIEDLEWQRAGSETRDPTVETPTFRDTDGVGPFGQIDVGVEMEISQVLIDVVTQNIIQSTKHLEVDGQNVFSERPTLVFGPAIRVGYGLWF